MSAWKYAYRGEYRGKVNQRKEGDDSRNYFHEGMGPYWYRTRDPWICSQTRICDQTRY